MPFSFAIQVPSRALVYIRLVVLEGSLLGDGRESSSSFLFPFSSTVVGGTVVGGTVKRMEEGVVDSGLRKVEWGDGVATGETSSTYK